MYIYISNQRSWWMHLVENLVFPDNTLRFSEIISILKHMTWSTKSCYEFLNIGFVYRYKSYDPCLNPHRLFEWLNVLVPRVFRTFSWEAGLFYLSFKLELLTYIYLNCIPGTLVHLVLDKREKWSNPRNEIGDRLQFWNWQWSVVHAHV